MPDGFFKINLFQNAVGYRSSFLLPQPDPCTFTRFLLPSATLRQPQSVGLLLTSEQPKAETSTLQQTSIPPKGFEPTIPARE